MKSLSTCTWRLWQAVLELQSVASGNIDGRPRRAYSHSAVYWGFVVFRGEVSFPLSIVCARCVCVFAPVVHSPSDMAFAI